jgi:predicted transcriptional regulator
MAGQIQKALRMDVAEKWLAQGMTHSKIAEKVGVSRRTLERYLSARKAKMMATLSERQIIVLDMMLRSSLEDHERLGQLIDEQEKFSLVVTDAYGKRIQILRNVANFLGISQNVKIQNIQNNLHLSDNRKAVSMNGPVQIIVEAGNGQFDPEFGEARVSSPSADEISSAQG